ncbi:CidA/LrgA family holin-like protein [Roseburia sp. 1XD42-34]|nr:CidA/LrgA family holin-like protein [Roseburia sp. 1XD42-34]RKI77227.1 CidA/LrgA family holin-like protein [Clostridium sp. 1xD42-85]
MKNNCYNIEYSFENGKEERNVEKVGKMIMHIGLLYIIFQFGNWIQRTLHLFIPGSVIGMIVLFLLLSTKLVRVSWIEEGANYIVANLAFFFIPVTVGIIEYYDLFLGKGSLLILIVLVSTMLVMGGSGFFSQWLMRRKEWKHE